MFVRQSCCYCWFLDIKNWKKRKSGYSVRQITNILTICRILSVAQKEQTHSDKDNMEISYRYFSNVRNADRIKSLYGHQDITYLTQDGPRVTGVLYCFWYSRVRASLLWFFNYNQQEAVVFDYLFLKGSTCFRQFLHPSSAAHNCTFSFTYCQLIVLQTGIVDEMELTSQFYPRYQNETELTS